MKTILIVEDELSIVRMLATILHEEEYAVIVAADGVEALELLRDNRPDMILSDMMMPVMGGVPAMLEMVKINPDVRIIAASGIPDNEVTAKAVGRQVRQFLAKPFSTDKLLRAVGRVMNS